MKQISIVIVTYNSEKDIYDCVKSIRNFADIPIKEIELIIIDNNSKNPIPMFENIRKEWGRDIVTIQNKKNGGYGQGNNIGIQHASAPIVLIMNPDVRLTSPCFKKVIKTFENRPQLSMYGMKQLLDDGRKSRSSLLFSNRINGYIATILMGFCNRFDIYIPKYMFFSGACFFIRKSMFESIGLFDESVFMYGEEEDIHNRMQARFGNHFFYDKYNYYKHLTLQRKESIETDLKMLKSVIQVNQKLSYPKEYIIRHKIQNTNILIWREKFKQILQLKFNSERLQMLKEYKHKLSQILNE